MRLRAIIGAVRGIALHLGLFAAATSLGSLRAAADQVSDRSFGSPAAWTTAFIEDAQFAHTISQGFLLGVSCDFRNYVYVGAGAFALRPHRKVCT